jgi:periplasmic protein CpxP/Spy
MWEDAMRKNSKVRLLVGFAVSAAVVGMVAAGVSYAQQPPPPPRGGMMGGQGQMTGGQGPMMRGRGQMMGGPFAQIRRGLAQLGLSDQQKTQIKAIFQGHKADIEGFAARMRPARQALDAAIRNGADEATIRAKAADVAAVQADMAVFRAAVRKQVFAVLTPDQQAKADQIQQQMAQRRMGMRGMGMRRGPGF